MREVVISHGSDTVSLSDVDSKYVYAGLNNSGEICVATKGYHEKYYGMVILRVGSTSNGGLTFGNGYTYNGEKDLQGAIETFSDGENTVYEFKSTKEFLQWALEHTN